MILPNLPMKKAVQICSEFWDISQKEAREKIDLALKYGWKPSKIADDICQIERWLDMVHGRGPEVMPRVIAWGALH